MNASLDLVLGFQVAIKTAEEFVNPSRTFVSVFTSFVTTTETVKFWQSIYHVSTDYQVIGFCHASMHYLYLRTSICCITTPSIARGLHQFTR